MSNAMMLSRPRDRTKYELLWFFKIWCDNVKIIKVNST